LTLRAAVVSAVTGAVGLLLVSLAYSLTTMGALRHDAIYLAEFHHSGQTDLAAYIIGESIGGGIYVLIASPVLGLALGLVGGAAGRLARSVKPRHRDPAVGPGRTRTPR
jgi:hypothetical protein